MRLKKEGREEGRVEERLFLIENGYKRGYTIDQLMELSQMERSEVIKVLKSKGLLS